MAQASGETARVVRDFGWSTKDSWTRRRRVIAKAEWMPGRSDGGANPRFLFGSSPRTTSLKPERWPARTLYEDLYCARGDRENRIKENRIKECQLDLGACPRAGHRPDPWADRTSARTMRANQLQPVVRFLRLCAHVRRIGLAHTHLAVATCASIRLKLLKSGAQVRVSVRRIKIAMASACPYQNEFALAHARIRAAAR